MHFHLLGYSSIGWIDPLLPTPNDAWQPTSRAFNWLWITARWIGASRCWFSRISSTPWSSRNSIEFTALFRTAWCKGVHRFLSSMFKSTNDSVEKVEEMRWCRLAYLPCIERWEWEYWRDSEQQHCEQHRDRQDWILLTFQDRCQQLVRILSRSQCPPPTFEGKSTANVQTSFFYSNNVMWTVRDQACIMYFFVLQDNGCWRRYFLGLTQQYRSSDDNSTRLWLFRFRYAIEETA